MAIRDVSNEIYQMAYDNWKTTPPDDDPFGLEAEARAGKEEAQERDWDDVIAALRDFAEVKKHGWPAAIRALAVAMDVQRGIFRG